MFIYKDKLFYNLNDIVELLKEDKNARNYIYRKMKKKYNERIIDKIINKEIKNETKAN